MPDVYANGLEISGKAVGAKTIAAMPDVCFTPPENPATPPGVPIPYPSFGMADDTESGTGTVFISGKTVNIKNKSDLSKTSGTEAGCAAKKGVITSKNTGKAYFNSWSNDVKFDGEPVIRNTDLSTQNHASPAGNTPPWIHIANMAVAGGKCDVVYQDLQGHAHRDSPCDTTKTGKESEHTAQAACFLHTRKPEKKCDNYKNYNEDDAPCICMEAARVKKKPDERKKKDTPHDKKSKAVKAHLDKGRVNCMDTLTGSIGCVEACIPPTAGDHTNNAAKSTVDEHPKTADKSQAEKDQVMECLTLINLAYIAGVKDSDTDEEAKKKVDDAKAKKICTKGICKAPKSKTCHGC